MMRRANLILATGTVALLGSVAFAGELDLICSADVVICETLTAAFEADHDIEVNTVRLSSGEVYAKIRAESRNPQTDI